jgi:hypothetical protein
MECVRSEPIEKGGNTAHVSSHAASADFKKGRSSTPLAFIASWVNVVNFIIDIVVNVNTMSPTRRTPATYLLSRFFDTWETNKAGHLILSSLHS